MNFTPQMDAPSKNRSKNYESITKYMVSDLITFRPEDEIGHVINTLLEKKISGAPVLNDKRELVGIISEQDCLRVILDSVYHNQPLSKGLVKDYMTLDPVTVDVSEDIVDVAIKFLNNKFRRFPVVEKGKLRGQVSKRDILRAAKTINATTW
ncbi:MAG: CBS domain-containing protein [Cyclobacteriaceae bacterium]